jgi:hypothetical protein
LGEDERERENAANLFLSHSLFFSSLFFSFPSLTKPIRTCLESNEKRKNEKREKKREKEGIGSTSLIFLSVGQSQSG